MITIDPGHGGRDPGAIGTNSVMEKDITLHVTKMIQTRLENVGIKVNMTRETDIFVPLNRRLSSAGDSCFISIHCNSFHLPAANGVEVFYARKKDIHSQRLANILQRNLVTSLRIRDRGVKLANFRVIRQTRIPAVLVELGFISNPIEAFLLSNQEGQNFAATGIVNSVREFLKI